ncbi:hypothetical protein [Pseudonocardia sp. HH130630-07]|uniref:hypothetical protein n=1 Tax=Pseudonocardia sp. HH130630-07 TaxID=1690815 RepID=UPI000814DF54|nr:hypothetical protein [Pseudonocardia sp. HH130630-07]ANY10614.1 hypothetical protein AFB00_29855 [Pseudonocardia sp. HH130630-07]
MDVPELIYGTNLGCVARRTSGATTASAQCGRGEAYAVPHTYTYPRRRVVRLYVCDRCGPRHPDAEPLTRRDAAVILARRADAAAQLHRAGRRAPDWPELVVDVPVRGQPGPGPGIASGP